MLQRRAIRLRVVLGIESIVPRDLQRFATLDRGPRVLRNHRNTAKRLKLRRRRRAFDFDNLHDARHVQRGLRVIGNHPSAVNRRTFDDGEEHSVEQCIDAELRASGDDIRTIDQLDLPLADVAELRGTFETQRVARWNAQVRRCFRELSIAGVAICRAMDDLVVHRLDVIDGDAPLRSRC